MLTIFLSYDLRLNTVWGNGQLKKIIGLSGGGVRLFKLTGVKMFELINI